jgi:putative transposase
MHAFGMGNTHRVQVAGMYHVTARSVAEECIFRDANDYTTFLAVLAGAVARCHAFCLMPTHYHLLGTFPEGELPRVVHRINRRYSTRFNRRWGRRGHVFDSPYRSILVESERQLVRLACYIANNPDDADQWPWSSYPGTIGVREPFSFVDPGPLLRAFGNAESLRIAVRELRKA